MLQMPLETIQILGQPKGDIPFGAFEMSVCHPAPNYNAFCNISICHIAVLVNAGLASRAKCIPHNGRVGGNPFTGECVISPSSRMERFAAIPEWETPHAVVVVWPERLPGKTVPRQTIIDSTLAFIRCAAKTGTSIVVCHKYRDQSESIVERVLAASPDADVRPLLIPALDDVWIRDWAPFPVRNGNEVRYVQQRYAPAYLLGSKAGERDARRSQESADQLADALGMRVTPLPLILDGGNFTHNGAGTAVATNRIVSDNESMSIREIGDSLKEHLGVQNLILVPVEPGDETGHVDGTIRFVNPTHLVVSDYPARSSEKEFTDALVEHVRRESGDTFTISRVLNEAPSYAGSEGIGSARGNHMNFVRLGPKLFMPSYGGESDAGAEIQLATVVGPDNVIALHDPSLSRLADLGGVLNCVTWQLYA